MNTDPAWRDRGYQIIAILGQNSLGGRVTYLAQQLASQQQVIIKQFQFAQLDTSWTAYDTYEQEIQLLRQLSHPGIPQYLDEFQTPSGFCMVQEYLEAQSLAVHRRWTPEQIKHIALSVLEILVYLQAQIPTIIHRDLKPENILIDDQRQVYLVDFGFARLGDGDVAASSLVKGTVGFMPPEQLFNRQLTAASDLYGLGATLICLLTGTPSSAISRLMDESYRLHFQHLVPPLKRGWLSWLTKLVEPRPQDRYANASEALSALQPLNVSRLPRVRLSRSQLEFTASQFGEVVTQTLTVSNPIPNTMLTGRWQVAPHASDPPHTPYDDAWITVEPRQFEGNEVKCKIAMKTDKLLADRSYQRQLILHANSSPETHEVAIQLQTAPPPTTQQPAYLYLSGLCLLFFVVPWLVSFVLEAMFDISEIGLLIWPVCLMIIAVGLAAGDPLSRKTTASKSIAQINTTLGATIGLIIGLVSGFFLGLSYANLLLFLPVMIAVGTMWGTSKAEEVNVLVLVVTVAVVDVFGHIFLPWDLTGFEIFLIYLGFLVFCPLLGFIGLNGLIRTTVKCHASRGFKPAKAIQAALLSAGLGAHLSTLIPLVTLDFLASLEEWQAGLDASGVAGLVAIVPTLLLIFLATIAPILLFIFLIAKLIIFPHLKSRKVVANYYKHQSTLIKP